MSETKKTKKSVSEMIKEQIKMSKKFITEEQFQLCDDAENACALLTSAASLLQNYKPADTTSLEFACDVRDAIADVKRALAILETVHECAPVTDDDSECAPDCPACKEESETGCPAHESKGVRS